MRWIQLFFLCLALLLLAPISIEVTGQSDTRTDLEVITPQNVGQLQPLATLGMGTIHDIALSGDGRLLAVGTTVGLWLYDLNQPDSEPVLAHPDETIRIEFSPDSSLIAYTSRGLYIDRINDDLTLSPEHGFFGIGWPDMVFSPDGNYLAVAGFEQRVILWHIETDEEVLLYQSEEFNGYANLAFSPDSRVLISSHVRVDYRWDVETGQLIDSYRPTGSIVGFTTENQPIILQLAYTGVYEIPDLFNLIVIGSKTENPPIVDLEREPLTTLAASPDGRFFITGSGNFGETEVSVRIWDVDTGDLISHIQSRYDIRVITIDNATSRIAIATQDSEVQIWNMDHVLANSSLRYDAADMVLDGFFPAANEILFSPDNRLLVAASSYIEHNSIRIWDTFNYRLVSPFPFTSLRGEVATNLTAFTDTSFIMSGRVRDAPYLWYHHTSEISYDGNWLRTVATTDYPARDLAISPDGGTLVIANGNGVGNNIELWDVSAGTQIRQLVGHNAFVETVAFSPTRNVFASGDADGWIYLWDVRTGIRLSSVDVSDGGVNEIAFSPDGTILASVADDDRLGLWNATNLQLIAEQTTGRPDSDSIFMPSVAFHPSGDFLAAVIVFFSGAHGIMFVDPLTGTQIYYLYGWHGFTNDIEFSPDGRLLAANTIDGTIHLWGVPAMEE